MEQSVRGNTCTSLDEYIVQGSKTRGSETSQYPEEEKINNDSVSSGERTRKSLNHPACGVGLRDHNVIS